MSGEARYTTVVWRCTEAAETSETIWGMDTVTGLLDAGWELHGGPIALPGERVLQALVRPTPATQIGDYEQGWKDGYETGMNIAGRRPTAPSIWVQTSPATDDEANP